LHQWKLNKANEAKQKGKAKDRSERRWSANWWWNSLFFFISVLLLIIYLVNFNHIFSKSCRNSRVRFLGIFAWIKSSKPTGTRPGGPGRCGCPKYWIFEAGTQVWSNISILLDPLEFLEYYPQGFSPCCVTMWAKMGPKALPRPTKLPWATSRACHRYSKGLLTA
jgi:hypothetical protein